MSESEFTELKDFQNAGYSVNSKILQILIQKLYVTHYQHEIPDSVDRVLRLDKGEVVGS